MTNRSPMHQQIDTLPDLIRAIVEPFDASTRRAIPLKLTTSTATTWRISIHRAGMTYSRPVLNYTFTK